MELKISITRNYFLYEHKTRGLQFRSSTSGGTGEKINQHDVGAKWRSECIKYLNQHEPFLSYTIGIASPKLKATSFAMQIVSGVVVPPSPGVSSPQTAATAPFPRICASVSLLMLLYASTDKFHRHCTEGLSGTHSVQSLSPHPTSQPSWYWRHCSLSLHYITISRTPPWSDEGGFAC